MRKRREIATTTKRSSSRQSAVAEVPPAVELTPDVAAKVMGLIDQIEALIPGFVPYDKNVARRVGGEARFAKELIPQIITTVTALPPAGGVNTFDVVEGQASLDFDDSVRPVVQRLSSLLDGVQFTSDSRLAKSGRQALSTYAWAKKHVKGPEGDASLSGSNDPDDETDVEPPQAGIEAGLPVHPGAQGRSRFPLPESRRSQTRR
jgi:hypothetical protein